MSELKDVPTAEPASRRRLIGGAVAAVAGLALRRSSARAEDGPAALNPAELSALVAWDDTLVPGARRAGVADFVQEQLRADPRSALLQLRMMNWPPPFIAFYRSGVAALNGVARRHARVPFDRLAPHDALSLAGQIVSGKVRGWPASPPLPAWVSATRADAMDVVYGTPRAMAAHDMPMLQVPPPRW